MRTYCREACDGGDNVCALIHDDDGTCAETRLCILQRVVIHPSPHLSARWKEHQHAHSQDFLALGRREDRDGASARNYTKQVIPSANNASTVFLYKLLQRDAHLLLHNTRVIDMATDAEQLGTLITCASKAREPGGSSSHNRRGD